LIKKRTNKKINFEYMNYFLMNENKNP